MSTVQGYLDEAVELAREGAAEKNLDKVYRAGRLMAKAEMILVNDYGHSRTHFEEYHEAEEKIESELR